MRAPSAHRIFREFKRFSAARDLHGSTNPSRSGPHAPAPDDHGDLIAMRATGRDAEHMAKPIQIRNVSDATHRQILMYRAAVTGAAYASAERRH